jgi:hypothetical protein
MAALVAAIHAFLRGSVKTWMPGNKAGHDDGRSPVTAGINEKN